MWDSFVNKIGSAWRELRHPGVGPATFCKQVSRLAIPQGEIGVDRPPVQTEWLMSFRECGATNRVVYLPCEYDRKAWCYESSRLEPKNEA